MYKLSKTDREYIEKNRGCYPPDLCWYAAMTHWGRERAVRDKVSKDFAGCGMEELLLPEMLEDGGAGEIRQDDKLLFGGYLFFRCRMSDEIYQGITEHPWVFKIFGRAYRIPQIIYNEEMERFKGVLHTVPRPHLVTRSQIGGNATIIEGLMKGLQGRVVGVTAQHVKIEAQFSFLDCGNSIVVCVPHAQVILESASGGHALEQMNQKAGNN